jgi:hypothetical protein
MTGLMHLKGSTENYDPNSFNAAVSSLNQIKMQHTGSMQSLMDDRDTKSIHSGITYNQSAIGEMNQAELDKLLAMKEKRIRDIRDRYLESSATIPTYH